MAWGKLVYLRDRGPTEIGAFGITQADEPLLITDVLLVPQQCTAVTVTFDDTGVADFFDDQVDVGRKPEQFARLWLHTHPGNSAAPSATDEETFARVFGAADWAVMFILARGGATYARLRFRAGPGGQLRIPVEVDFGDEFAGSNHGAWNKEYQQNIRMPLPDLPLDPMEPFEASRLERQWDYFGGRNLLDLDDPFFIPEEIR